MFVLVSVGQSLEQRERERHEARKANVASRKRNYSELNLIFDLDSS